MRHPDLFTLFAEPLNRLGLTYMVTGGVAAILYGEPRLTHDLDLVLTLGRDEAPRLWAAFGESEFYMPPLEVIELEAGRSRYGHFNIIHHESAQRADVYLAGVDPFTDWAFARRRSMSLERGNGWVAPPEYVIVHKLRFRRDGGSDQHLRDIRAILAYVGDTIDHETLQAQIDRMGVRVQWDEVERSRPR